MKPLSVQPLVSILIPAFNAERWIGEAIGSALAQSWERTEVVVVDDGSRDGTLAAARRFAGDRVRVETQPNRGASAARNRALELAAGDYIQWLDADDVLDPEKIARQMDVLAGAGDRVLASGAWGRFFNCPGRTRFAPGPLWRDLDPVEWMVGKLQSNAYMASSAWLVSRRLTEAAGPWDVEQLRDNDGEYFCRVVLASERVRFVPEAKVYCRVAGLGSLSSVGSDAKLDSTLRAIRLYAERLRAIEDSPRTRSASVQCIQDYIVHFAERPDLVAAAQRLARELGGEVELPLPSWKHRWARRLFGARGARQMRAVSAGVRFWTAKSWDRLLAH